jgi:EAL domain-containing protein (putative c-di-GMP-specific phosphodiesterase class I)
LSVNVSARSLDDPRFVERVSAALTWYDVPGALVGIELTERSLLATSDNVQKSLARFSELGLQVGLDDFGTGYSATAHLQRFPLRFLKIARGFVGRLRQSKRDDAVVASVIDLAHAHEMVVVAEGIETAEQLAALREMRCDRGQGFLIAAALDHPSLEAFACENRHW